MTDQQLDKIMKICQVGDGRLPPRWNDFLADVYGAIGFLREERRRLLLKVTDMEGWIKRAEKAIKDAGEKEKP